MYNKTEGVICEFVDVGHLSRRKRKHLDWWDEDYLDREWWKLHQDPDVGATDADWEAMLKRQEEGDSSEAKFEPLSQKAQQAFQALREAVNSI